MSTHVIYITFKVMWKAPFFHHFRYLSLLLLLTLWKAFVESIKPMNVDVDFPVFLYV